MVQNKTTPTAVTVEDFLVSIAQPRRAEAEQIIEVMRTITGQDPRMWGPSIIGFGQKHYAYDTGREGDVPALGFSPRKKAMTVYFLEGFNRYGEELQALGKYTISVSCLYVAKLDDINMSVLTTMLEKSYILLEGDASKPDTVDAYIASIPAAAQPVFLQLRELVRSQLPDAEEVLSYGIVGYKIDQKRARVYISGWKDHVAMYPVPKSERLQSELQPYIKGKGTVWFSLDASLPARLIQEAVADLAA